MMQNGDGTDSRNAVGGAAAPPGSTPKVRAQDAPGSAPQRTPPPAGHGPSGFGRRIAQHFPEVGAHIDESDVGILNLEIGALTQASRDAIAAREWDTLAKHFAFVAEALGDGSPGLRDAINVSYLGSLFYGETSANYAKARTLLPVPLARALEHTEAHYEQLVP